jgi:4-amino-4-deoxy-L-arabinose transferase-like glycosyltransferase
MSDSIERKGNASWLLRLAPWLLIGGLVLFHAANNWVWLTQNVTSTGWDKPRHLAHSLADAQMLSPVTVKSLFNVIISDPVRTPLYPASATIMYKLFGTSDDIATMVNVIYMLIMLAATYGIGRRWAGRRLGLIGVALLAIFPMFYAMSRYFYVEFSLGAMVAVTVYLLLATEGFQRKGMSLLFGLSLGLGMLTKRTFAVFGAGPLLAVILTSGLLPALWQRIKKRPRIYWKKAIVACLGGLALAAIWYFPNREAVRGLILGDALFFAWWILAALAIYFAILVSAPLANALSAGFLAAGLASTWYLARVEFVQRVFLYGYGIDDPRGRTMRLNQLGTYLYYIRKLGNEHLSLLIFLVFLLAAAVGLVVYLRRQGSLIQAWRQVRPEGWAVLAWAGGAYAVLTLSIYQETRAFTPALPAVALLFGAALLKIPWRRIRWGLLALVLAFGLVQFFVLSYEPVNRLLPPQIFTLPGWGRTGSFADGVYIQLPDEGRTDSRYAIERDVLQRMEQRRQELGQDLLSMGMLVNMSQINAGPFNYLILTEYPYLRVESLIERFSEASPYSRLFAHQYVLVKRVNSGMNPSQEEVIEAILDGPPPLFAQTFEVETTYPMPGGDTVFLYRQRYSLPPDYPVEYVSHAAQELDGQTRAGDAILLTPPEIAGPFVSSYTGQADIYMAPDTEEELTAIASQHRRLFLVLGDAQVGTVQGLDQDWLNQHAFRASHEWVDSLQVLTYGTVAGTPATAPATQVGAMLGEQIELAGYDLPFGPWKPGDVVPLTFFWQAEDGVEEDYNVFVHLVDSNGQIVAQTDSAPGGGSQPTSGWTAGQTIVDRHGLLLPPGSPVGKFELRLGMYLPSNGERLPVVSAEGEGVGDSLSLGTFMVASP